MKILYLARAAIPSETANSVHVMKMCSAFAANGAAIELVVPGPAGPGESGGGDPHRYYDVARPFPITRLAGIPLLKPSHAFAVKVFAALRAGRFRPDLVYSRDLLGGFAALLAGCPLVLEIHHPMRDSGRLHGWLFDRIARHRRFVGLVVITRALARWHQEHTPVPPDKIVVAPDGADVGGEPARGVCLVAIPDNGRFRAGYVGSLYAGKGLEVIVPLARLLPEVDFHVLGGSGDLLHGWRERTQGVENLYFHGYCPPSGIAAFLAAMDVLLVPNQRTVRSVGGSEIGRWTSPLKLFESMAAGKPVVASDLEVLREVLVPGENCLLCPPDDIAAWQQALLQLREDRALAARLAANARAELLERYTWEKRAAMLLKFLAGRR
ncbi:MAG: glycosyltransferase family 4 protein [Deltaproteobacteria bacterium]|nr:MAG: glycosyltransferase family 4 protein [Deltaproteobacteria bacterium]